MLFRLKKKLANSPRLAASLELAISSAGGMALAMIAAKLLCVGAVLSVATGPDQLSNELSVGGVAAWFTPDILFGLVLGALIGGLLGLLRHPRRRQLANLSLALLILVQFVITIAVVTAVYIYALFGTPPTWQMLESLGGHAGGADATDSVVNIVFRWGTMLSVAVVLVVMVGGTLLLGWIFKRSRRWRLAAAILFGVLALIPMLGVTFASAPSRLELDRNGLVEFLRTALGPDERLTPASSAGTFQSALRPLDTTALPKPPLEAYRLIKAAAAERRLNVVLAILETTAVKQMQVTGAKLDNTPTLSALARQGIIWRWHYAHMPSSMPAIYTILSGNYSAPGEKSITETRPRIACRTISEVLKERGYRCSLWHSGRFSFYKKDLFLAGRGYEALHDATSLPNRGRYHEGSWGVEEAATIEAMLDWIREVKGSPFFVTYIPVYPHHPYDVPHARYRRYPGRSRIKKFRNCIYYMDQMIGELVAGLSSIGVAKDTLIILVGDHGEGFGEHPGSKLHGTKIYDEGVRTFALWFAPGVLKRGYVERRRLGQVAIAPTLLDLFGIDPQAEHVGLSALSARPRPMIPIYTGYGHALIGFVDSRHKFIFNQRSRAAELYDLSSDPGETRDLSPKKPQQITEYYLRARRFVAAQQIWEAKLPDLESRPSRTKRKRRGVKELRWVVDPATCDWPSGYFRVKDGLLQPIKKGKSTVTCTRPLPAVRGRVTGLKVRGNERIGGAWIEASVQHAAAGRRRGLTYCLMNQGTRCVAHPSPARNVLPGGGDLELDIRYVMFYRVPKDVTKYNVREVEVRFELERGP